MVISFSPYRRFLNHYFGVVSLPKKTEMLIQSVKHRRWIGPNVVHVGYEKQGLARQFQGNFNVNQNGKIDGEREHDR